LHLQSIIAISVATPAAGRIRAFEAEQKRPPDIAGGVHRVYSTAKISASSISVDALVTRNPLRYATIE
jgi:hypothetical protein